MRNRWLKKMLKLLTSIIVGWLVSLWAIPAAYAERGYKAIGGEWLLICFVVGITYWFLSLKKKV